MLEYSISGYGLMSDTGHTDTGGNDLKTWIASHIARRMKTAGLTRTAGLMGLKRSDLPAVPHGGLNGYSVERPARCLPASGDEARLTVKEVDGSEDFLVPEDAWPMLTRPC